jgi:trk system potassium uptake protein TrkH
VSANHSRHSWVKRESDDQVIDIRPVLFLVGVMLAVLGIAMWLPAFADLAEGHPDWRVFLASSVLTVFLGVGLALANRVPVSVLTARQAFLLTTAAWVVIAAFGAIPLAISGLGLGYTDAFFESMSGITTTGSTVIVGLDQAPPGVLLWRGLLQWLGGIGIIVMAIAILPMLRVGGMQLFRMESSDTSEKVLPRAAQIAAATGFIYVALTAICVLSLWGAGMTGLEALVHAMTTVATGGFSTSDASVGHFASAPIDWIVILFMILGSLPFVLYLQAVRGAPLLLWRDSQVRTFLAIVLVCIVAVVAWRAAQGGGDADAVRTSAFNVVSIITGTGYSTADFGTWGTFAVAAFFFFMFIGGCAGSTSCGIKVFRYQVVGSTALTQLRQLLRPHGVFAAHYNGKPIPDSVTNAVLSFVFLFVLVFGLLALALMLIGLDFVTALSGAASAIANVGPGLGPVIGPMGTYASLPDLAKWLLAGGMLLGRLELFTVLVLFTPGFWRG